MAELRRIHGGGEVKPVHVLYLHQYFVPPDGAGGTRSYEMARRLVRAGHRVTLITSNQAFPASYGCRGRRKEIDLEGIHLVVVDVPYSNFMGFGERLRAFFEFAARSALEAARAKEVDLILATSTPLTIVLPGILASLRHRRPMVLEIRDVWPEVPIAMGALRNPVSKGLARLLELAAYRASRSIVALSPGMKQSIVRSGVPPEKITVVPNCANPHLFSCSDDEGRAFVSTLLKGRQGPVVLYAGTLGMLNGIGYLVEIAREMARVRPDASFLVVGDGREREEVRARAAEIGLLDESFFMLPPVPKAELPRLYAGCTAAVSLVIDRPALWNNSANKFFDATAAGRPIVINHEGWMADLLRETEAGLVVPANDAAAAAAMLASFLADEQRLEHARIASRKLAAESFDVDRLAERLCRVLERTAAA